MQTIESKDREVTSVKAATSQIKARIEQYVRNHAMQSQGLNMRTVPAKHKV